MDKKGFKGFDNSKRLKFAVNATNSQSKPKNPGPKKSKHHLAGHRDFDDAKMIKKKKEEQLRLEELTNSRQHSIQLARKTRFTLEQVEALIKIFKRLTSLGKMDRLRFRETLYSTFEITDDVILDRTFGAFDGDSQGSVSETEWVLGMSAFLRGNLDEQIAYSYEVYDINSDRGIGREEVYHFLQNCISPLPGEGLAGIEPEEVAECCRDIAEMAMRKLDVDRNGIISYVDFSEAVNKDPLMLEALGPCLAPSNRIKVFLSLFTEDYWNYSTSLSHPHDLSWDRERNKFNRKRELLAAMRKKTTNGSVVAPLLTHKERKKIGIQKKASTGESFVKLQQVPLFLQDNKDKLNMKPSKDTTLGSVKSKSTFKMTKH